MKITIPDRTIERERKMPYAVKVVTVSPDDKPEAVETALEHGLFEMSERAKAAGMVLLNVTQHCTPVDGSVLVYTITAQWMSKEELERLQHQQRIIGGGPGPLRSM